MHSVHLVGLICLRAVCVPVSGDGGGGEDEWSHPCRLQPLLGLGGGDSEITPWVKVLLCITFGRPYLSPFIKGNLGKLDLGG